MLGETGIFPWLPPVSAARPLRPHVPSLPQRRVLLPGPRSLGGSCAFKHDSPFKGVPTLPRPGKLPGPQLSPRTSLSSSQCSPPPLLLTSWATSGSQGQATVRVSGSGPSSHEPPGAGGEGNTAMGAAAMTLVPKEQKTGGQTSRTLFYPFISSQYFQRLRKMSFRNTVN